MDDADARYEALRERVVSLAARNQALIERMTVLERALENAQGEAYLGALEGDDTPDPLKACHLVMTICREALEG